MITRLRRATTDRRKMFVAVTVLTVATIAVVEILTVGAARTQLVKRTDSALQSQANTAAAATNARPMPP